MKNKKEKVVDWVDSYLCERFMYWFRVSRAENGLKGDDRKLFQEIVKEIKNRRLLSL